MNPAILLLLLGGSKHLFEEEEGLLLLPFLSAAQNQSAQATGTTTVLPSPIDPTTLLLLMTLGRKAWFGRGRPDRDDADAEPKKPGGDRRGGRDPRALFFALALGALGQNSQYCGTSIPTPVPAAPTTGATPPTVACPGATIDPTTMLLLTALEGRFFCGERGEEG
jgi:hypothetical protein